MIKILMILMVTISLGFGLTNKQISDAQIVYTVGKFLKASDGETFGKALTGMFGQESSWGTLSVGDKYDSTGRLKSLYDSSLGGLQIKLSTAKLTIRKYPELRKKYGYMLNTGKSTYKEYASHKKKIKYYKKIIESPTWIKRYENGNMKALRTIAWAKRELVYHQKKFNQSRSQAHKDTLLINTLMNSVRVSADIGGHYLLSMYEEALKKGFRDPWKKAIGRYNGGWRNTVYYPKVKKRIKVLNELIKKGAIS